MSKKIIKHIDLKSIKNPDFLKEMNYKELDVLSNDIRNYILESTSKNGGHLSSNLGVVDATIAMCRSFDFSKDKLIFDVGHQCYTYKILTGRSLDKLRKSDGVSGYQKMSESPYDHYEAGHSSTSISAASGLAAVRDLNKEKYHVVSFIGDASIANGLALEGLNNLGQGKHKVIIILNDNDMSISKPVGATAKFFRKVSNSSFYLKSKSVLVRFVEKTTPGKGFSNFLRGIKNWIKRHLMSLNVFDLMGFKTIGPIDGHDIKQLEKSFTQAKKINKSVIVFINTKKGKGYPFAEQDTCGEWHGVGKFDIDTGEELSHNSISWSKHIANIVDEQMGINDKIITIVPGTSYGSCLTDTFVKYPERCIDVGIAEEHAFTLASGIAVGGYRPIISVYSTFLQRGYDEINHDLARMKCNATILIDRSGLVGSDGDTHQGLFDEQLLLGIPNTVVCMPSLPCEAVSLFKESLNNHGVFAIRYPKDNILEVKQKECPVEFGKWKEIIHGENTAVVAFGPVIIKLKELLEKGNSNVSLINAIYQKPMDLDMIKELLNYKKIIIYNPYSIEEGFCQNLASTLLKLKYKGEVIIKAVPDTFVKHGTVKEQRTWFELNPSDIIKII